MNYVPLNQKQEQSSSSPISFHNSSTFYINQQKPVLNLPKPRFNLTVSGHHPRPTHDFSRSTIQTPEIRPPRTPIPFSTIMPVTRTDNPFNNVQQKLAALTLRLEKELESETTVGEYYGQCTKCNQPITGSSSDACQAMGELYHNNCFKCVLCARILRGKAFYRIHDQVYCEEDYLVRTKTSSIFSRWDTFLFCFSLPAFNKQ